MNLRRDSSFLLQWEQTQEELEPREAFERENSPRQRINGPDKRRRIAKSRGSLDHGEAARVLNRRRRRNQEPLCIGISSFGI